MGGVDGSEREAPEIVVVGSANLDAAVRLPRLPVPGETLLGGDVDESVGGTGANQAVAAARLGRSVAMVGRIGADPPGRRIRDALAAEGVDVAHLESVDGAVSGRAFILVDGDGENMIIVSPGANGLLSADGVRAAAPLLASARAVVCQLEIPQDAVAEAVRLAGGLVVMNPSPARPVAADVLGRVDVLVVNRSELAYFAGAAEPDTADGAGALAGSLSGPGAVVVTLGADGAVIARGRSRVHVPAEPAGPVVDPTGAGDTFCGALTDALVRGESLERAVRWAVRAGGYAVTAEGAQSAMPTADRLGAGR